MGAILLIALGIAITFSIAACKYFYEKSNQQRSAVVPGGPVMLVPALTAPVATSQEDLEKKEADDTRQETENGTPQQGPG